MRPGLLAPDYTIDYVELPGDPAASMRPGLLAPDYGITEDTCRKFGYASMRPGLLAPDYGRSRNRDSVFFQGFNEAGATRPGLPTLKIVLCEFPGQLQ